MIPLEGVGFEDLRQWIGASSEVADSLMIISPPLTVSSDLQLRLMRDQFYQDSFGIRPHHHRPHLQTLLVSYFPQSSWS